MPWRDVSSHAPCAVCDKPDWCSVSRDGAWAICRRVNTGEGLHKVDKAGGEYWLYRLDGARPEQRQAVKVPPQPIAQCADVGTRDRVYRALLAMLPLTAAHRGNLQRRGLNDTEIGTRMYRSLPVRGRAALAKRLVEQFGATTCARIPGLYVAEQEGRHWWSLAGAAGLAIPVRDLAGHIVALKIRADDPGSGPRYTTVSSAKHHGPGPGVQVHVPLFSGSLGSVIRVSEGEIKGDVATALSGTRTLALPGVALWREALPALQVLHATRVWLAFDADWRTNPHVAYALGQVAFALVDAGYTVEVEDWEAAQGKGIDDLLAAGHAPALKPAALAFGALVRSRARVWTGTLKTIAAEEIPAWH
jgi:hypothetical protein